MGVSQGVGDSRSRYGPDAAGGGGSRKPPPTRTFCTLGSVLNALWTYYRQRKNSLGRSQGPQQSLGLGRDPDALLSPGGRVALPKQPRDQERKLEKSLANLESAWCPFEPLEEVSSSSYENHEAETQAEPQGG